MLVYCCDLSVTLCYFLHSMQSGSPLHHTCKRQRASPRAKWSSGRSLVRRCHLHMCSPNASTHAGYFLNKTFHWLVIRDKQKDLQRRLVYMTTKKETLTGKWNFFSISPNSHSNINRNIWQSVNRKNWIIVWMEVDTKA